ncbi:response regulator [Pseudorhodoferax soli]|uniref:Response regulator receiver domain-containing protein n=1 Tax=Pseudorhodoferax soli TaxID=545864 RepID=A0A368XEF6_9BURK|nr:response regulator [Pseudorhodoferax soli]RCW66245.1 response regulator receiver domain-containing protein [Pseudorhodoferax soli]
MPYRTFLVEDDPLIRRQMTAMLEEVAGAQIVGIAETEEAAIEAMARIEWDVAVVDLQLRIGSGIGVARAFSERDSSQRLYVVTNHATSEVCECCRALKVDNVFDKLTELDALLDALVSKA